MLHSEASLKLCHASVNIASSSGHTRNRFTPQSPQWKPFGPLLLFSLSSQLGLFFMIFSNTAKSVTAETTTETSSLSQMYTQSTSDSPETTAFTTNVSAEPDSTSSSELKEILLGYITTLTYPDNPELADGNTISGAMTLAVNTINADPSILPGYKLVYVLGDNQGSDLRSLSILTDQWNQGALAFFGPEDSCEVESRMAAAWELPILAYKCNDPVVSDKTRFPTLARTQPPASHCVRSVIALMKFYNWSQFSIIVEEIELMPRAGLNLFSSAKEHNFTVNHFVNISGPYSPIYSQKSLYEAIDNTYDETRIYVVFSRWPMFQAFVTRFHKLGLTQTGEYVFIGILIDQPFQDSMSTDLMFLRSQFTQDRKNESVEYYQNVLVLVGLPITNPNYSQWEKAAVEYLYLPPVNSTPLNDYLRITINVPVFATYLYDSVFIYARALHEVLASGGSTRNGTLVFNRLTDRTFQSIQGHEVYIDKNGDAEGNYTVLALQPMNNPFGRGLRPVGRFNRSHVNRQEVLYIADVDIFGNHVPLDEPVCGFHGDKCRTESSLLAIILGGSLGGVAVFLVLTLIVIYRNWRYEQELASLIWKIDLRDIQMETDTAISALSFISSSGCQNTSLDLGPDQDQRFTKVGVYKGNFVAIKSVRKKMVDTSSRDIKLELKLMRELRHDNVVQFVGATIESGNINIVSEYCSKGSLEDILENSDVKLDDMFIASIVSDILKGMIYIHGSRVVSHGNLKSSNCLVDSRWVVKIGDFGLNKFKQKQEIPYHGEHACYKRLLWTAPEILRMDKPPLGGTQKGDVYSFGIVLYEVLNRNGPYSDCHLAPKEIVQKVREGPQDGIPFRPGIAELSCEKHIVTTMVQCWDENPDVRPDFKTCRKALRSMQKGMRSNIFDNMMMMMEKYADNLESVVAERTMELQEEKKKTESLLHRMLPTSVAAQLVRGEPVIPEAFDCVTIYFSDICGFTAMSSESTPLQIVDMLNDLYTLFDCIIKDYDVYKVETIGDAYMVVSGLPNKNVRHAGEIASMSLALLAGIKQFKIAHRPTDVLKLRIGIHSGPCVAGVVGQTMPRYCLFGDTVNTASRMESNGEALKIHVSPACKNLLDELGGYVLVERGVVSMKGKGEVLTYWLVGEDTQVRPGRDRQSDSHNFPVNVQPMFVRNGRFIISKSLYSSSPYIPRTGSSVSSKLHEIKADNYLSSTMTSEGVVFESSVLFPLTAISKPTILKMADEKKLTNYITYSDITRGLDLSSNNLTSEAQIKARQIHFTAESYEQQCGSFDSATKDSGRIVGTPRPSYGEKIGLNTSKNERPLSPHTPALRCSTSTGIHNEGLDLAETKFARFESNGLSTLPVLSGADCADSGKSNKTEPKDQRYLIPCLTDYGSKGQRYTVPSQTDLKSDNSHERTREEDSSLRRNKVHPMLEVGTVLQNKVSDPNPAALLY